MKNLRSFYNKFKIKDLLYFVLILPISITLISNGACADKLEKSNTIIQEMFLIITLINLLKIGILILLNL